MVRNIVLLGHQDCGKTMLAESMLYVSKNSDRCGHIEEGNTVSDFDSEERRRKMSIQTSVIPLYVNNEKINVLDTPGYLEFVGETLQGIKGADAAIVVVSGRSGVKVGTQREFQYALDERIPISFFINKLDKENSDFEKSLKQLKEEFGQHVVAINIPYIQSNEMIGMIDLINEKMEVYDKKRNTFKMEGIPPHLKETVYEYRSSLIEAIVECDELLLEKYVEDGELTLNEIKEGFIYAFQNGEVYPVLCGSSHTFNGISLLVQTVQTYYPTIYERVYGYMNEKTGKVLNVDEGAPFVGLIFKTVADPFVGKMSYFRVLQGEFTSDVKIFNRSKNEWEKSNNLYSVRGKDLTRVDRIQIGDIGVITKLQYSETGDTLCDDTQPILVCKINFPEATHNMVVSTNKGDEERLSNGLARIQEEDKTIHVHRDEEFNDLHIIGMGDTHLDIIKFKLQSKFNVMIDFELPKIPYRETIKGKVDVQGKYKKQSGGHGQYGDVKILFEHRPDDNEDLMFVDKIVGGAVPRQFIPAVEKGLQEAMVHGVLGGFPVIQLKATLHDGTYHSVDSSEFAFKAAASIAYKKGLEDAEPRLLEPIVQLNIFIPDTCIGDVIGDLNKRRGRVVGMEEEDGTQHLIVEVPLAEVLTYTIDLKSISAAQGYFTQSFLRYEEVPDELVASILEKYDQ